jgi:hypothetical protein
MQRIERMLTDVDNIQEIGKAQLEAVHSVSASIAKALQVIAAETTEFMKSSIEGHNSYVERLLSAKSLEELTQIQSEFAKVNYDRLAEQGTRIRRLYTNIAQEIFTPMKAGWDRRPAEQPPDLGSPEPAPQLETREKAKRRREARTLAQGSGEDYSTHRPN